MEMEKKILNESSHPVIRKDSLCHEAPYIICVQFGIHFLRLAWIIDGQELDLAATVQLRQCQPQ